ncbi:MAG: pyruvate:ferredoxin (flavodoxin) oxidoreductase, partial [Fastidiosipila sp.]|nr:pyruvate:ferredoxin (flavodoxin) oxidoreductase [Fastidiosipila sp.]
YYGAPDAEEIIICMGSVYGTACETVDFLNSRGRKTGVLHVHLYRPFVDALLLGSIPESVKRIAVLDRTKESGSTGEPLYLDVVKALCHTRPEVEIVGGRYGLGSKNTTPSQIISVFDNLKLPEPKTNFTIGIVDDVSYLSLPEEEEVDVTDKDTFQARFWGLGSDGTVGANKNSIKIIGDHTDQYAQAYFSYDSKKSGGVTISDLRFGKKPIRAPYLVHTADFVACHTPAYIYTYDMLAPLKKGGSFLLNIAWSDEEIEAKLPASIKRALAERNAEFYVIDAATIAEELGLGGRINTICQAAFFKISKVIPVDDAVTYMKQAIVSSYGKRGEDIVKMNYNAVDAGISQLRKVEVPESWNKAEDKAEIERDAPDFITDIADVMNRQEGDSLPVSAFVDHVDGTFPQGTSRYEKRGIAFNIPRWIPENCIQCNQCSYVCPHAVIRPFLLTEEEKANAPEDYETITGMRQYDQYQFRIQPSALDCTGCGNCAEVCPSKEKSLVMEPLADQMHQAENWDYSMTISRKENPLKKFSVKGSQFEEPLLECSGACAGCGETPYVKLATQLFGDRMMIANATGCTSIWGGSAPSMPYCPNRDGHGPSWANSLFEDNAEYGFGMYLGYNQIRNRALQLVKDLEKFDDLPADLSQALADFNEFSQDRERSREVSDKLTQVLKNCKLSGEAGETCKRLSDLSDYLMLRSQWIIGGDGWAYDIGFGGLDHVLASGEDVNVLVLDTEVYSNTGGQASKATPLGAVAQFAAGGKERQKKDLGLMAMSYGYVYVAQISMGANYNQTLKALREAEEYDGPSLVIAYAPCINHGIRGGMVLSQQREKDAVETGYWHLYRFNPDLEAEGKNPFVLDSREPKRDYTEFLKGEVRYTSLSQKYSPEKVDEIFAKARDAADRRYKTYQRLAAAEE